MKRSRARMTLFALACLFFVGGLSAGENARPFTLADAAGAKVSLADFAGRPVVLHFWASWCPYCKTVQPGLDALTDEYAAENLVVLGINIREDKGVEPQAVLEERGLEFKTLLQGDSVATAYRVRGTPTTFFINAEGEIVGMTNASKADDPVLTALADKASGRGQ